MRQPEEMVWAVIIESAKRRFDYDAFKCWLSEVDDERIAEYILRQLIEGSAEGLVPADLSLDLRAELELFGLMVSDDELCAFIATQQTTLRVEINAARETLSAFAQGISAPELLMQISETLT